MNDSDSTRLWEQFHRTGDPAIFEQLYRAYREQVMKYYRAVLGDEETAQALMHTLFAKLFLRRPPVRTTFRNLLFAWASKLRLRPKSERGERSAPLPAVDPPAVDPPTIEQGEITDAIGGAISRLPPEERKVFILHAMLGFSFTEIANILGISRWTVKRLYDKARRRLQGGLGEF